MEVNASRCKRNGISPSDVLSVLSGYIGGNYASNMNRFSKLYRVMVQASPEYRLDTEALNNMFVRNDEGEMSPVGQYLKLTRVYGAETLSRFNLFSAISVNGIPADGYSTGQAIEALREVAAENASGRLRLRVRRYVARRGFAQAVPPPLSSSSVWYSYT